MSSTPTPPTPCPTATGRTSSPPTPSCTAARALPAARPAAPHAAALRAPRRAGRRPARRAGADRRQQSADAVAAHPHRHRRPAASNKHPAYVEMERLALSEFGLAAMSHREETLGWKGKMPPLVKYVLTYLFVQAEFGLCCPVSMTDSLTRTLKKFGSPRTGGALPAALPVAGLRHAGPGRDVHDRAGGRLRHRGHRHAAPRRTRRPVAPARRQVVLLQSRRRLRDGAGARRRRAGRHEGRVAVPAAAQLRRTAAPTTTASCASRTSWARARWPAARSGSKARSPTWSASRAAASSRWPTWSTTRACRTACAPPA